MVKLVVGLTGTLGSGKEMAKLAIKKNFSCYYVTLSTIIRGELERKKQTFNRAKLQELGDQMRKQYGPHILAMLAVEYLPRNKDLIIIDGIRNPGEVEYLKKKFGGQFLLIAIDAPQNVRWERVQKRGEKADPKNFEEFVEVEKRDLGEAEPDYGQQVKACMKLADVTVINDGSVEDLEKKMKEAIQARV